MKKDTTEEETVLDSEIDEFDIEEMTEKFRKWMISNRDCSEKTRTQMSIFSESEIILMNSGRSTVSLETDSTSQYSPLTEYPLDLTHFMIKDFCLFTESPFTLVRVRVLIQIIHSLEGLTNLHRILRVFRIYELTI